MASRHGDRRNPEVADIRAGRAEAFASSSMMAGSGLGSRSIDFRA